MDSIHEKNRVRKSCDTASLRYNYNSIVNIDKNKVFKAEFKVFMSHLLKILYLSSGVKYGLLLRNPLQLPGQVEVELVELHGLAERLLPRLGGGFEGLDGLPQLFAVADDVVPVKMTVGYRTTNYSKSVPYQGNRFMQ